MSAASYDPIKQIAADRAKSAVIELTVADRIHLGTFDGARNPKPTTHPAVAAYGVMVLVCALLMFATGALAYRQLVLVDMRIAADGRV